MGWSSKQMALRKLQGCQTCTETKPILELRLSELRHLLRPWRSLEHKKWSPMVVVEPTHLININGSFPQVKGENNKNLWFLYSFVGGIFPRKRTNFHWKSMVGKWYFLLKWSLFRWHINFRGFLKICLNWGDDTVDAFSMWWKSIDMLTCPWLHVIQPFWWSHIFQPSTVWYEAAENNPAWIGKLILIQAT